MQTQTFSRLLTFIFCLCLIGVSIAPATARADTFNITTQVTAGQGRIDTVGPLTDVLIGESKHFQIRPAEGWMIEYDQQFQQPELFIEAIRLYYNRTALVTGKNAQWRLPITCPANVRPDKLDEATANVYPIAAGFRVPVLPCGIAWDRLVHQEGIPTTGTVSARYTVFVIDSGNHSNNHSNNHTNNHRVQIFVEP